MQSMLKTGILVALLFPIIVTQLVGVDTSGWDATLVTIWDNLPVFGGVAVAFLFLRYVNTNSRGA